MTILEELIDIALRCCEKGRQAGQKGHARGAALLADTGSVYTGCDVYAAGVLGNAIRAEKTAVLTAVADGVQSYKVRV